MVETKPTGYMFFTYSYTETLPSKVTTNKIMTQSLCIFTRTEKNRFLFIFIL